MVERFHPGAWYKHYVTEKSVVFLRFIKENPSMVAPLRYSFMTVNRVGINVNESFASHLVPVGPEDRPKLKPPKVAPKVENKQLSTDTDGNEPSTKVALDPEQKSRWTRYFTAWGGKK